MAEQELKRDRSQRSRAARPTAVARHGRLPRSRAWKSALAILGSSLAVVLVATGSVAGIAAFQLADKLTVNSVDINKGTAAPVPEIGAYEGGFNVLVVGSDEFYDRDTVLNDVNILIHVSADHTSAVAVSIPRDLVVPFPSCVNEETGKASSPMSGRPINEALFYGGLPCAVAVVENLTGLDIQYAGMIGFEGVANMSTAIGGVDVCIQNRLRDKWVGLDLEPGTHTLSGWDALMFLRSRHGVGDGSDLTRISSQQVFLSSLLRKLKSEDTLTNVSKLISLAQVAADNMQLSRELTQPATIISMAKALNNIPMDRITFVQYPGSTGGDGIYLNRVQPKTHLANQLFDAIRADQPIGVEKVGDGTGSVVDPNATAEPAPEPDPAATPDPNATDAPPAPLPDKVVISGINGQTAADQTCTRAN